ncbi:MAG: YihY family inner membrane protein [Desulfuromonadales bacterium]|nr:YihY family inner membrane protein [Desulfuromonadales bacterium]
MKGRMVGLLRAGYLLTARFTDHQGQLRAAGLTYTTVLSLIPLLAIAFAVLKGLGAQNTLEPILLDLAGDSEETISHLISYVNNTNFKSIGAIGLLVLVMTAISLLEHIEKAFNTTWGVRETRPFARRFSDYLSVIVVGPILIMIATSLTTSLQNQGVVLWLLQREYFGETLLVLFRLLPYVSIWVALIFLYIFIPNARVKFRSAALGGIIAGTTWQIAQWGYFHFQVGVANYNAIYGTLSAVPIFLVWIYTSWLIVLFGLEIVYAHQFHEHLMPDMLGQNGATTADELALAVLIQVGSCFHSGGTPPDAGFLAEESGLPLHTVEDTLESLAEEGFLVRTDSSQPGWVPAREPSGILVADVLVSLRGTGNSSVNRPPALAAAGELISSCGDAVRNSLHGLTLHDLVVGQMEKRVNQDTPDKPVT